MPLIDNRVTRMNGGITNVLENDIFNSLREPDPTIYNRLFEDFHIYTAAQWSVGGQGTPARAQQAGLGGLLRLTTTAVSGDNSWLQTINPTFQIVAGKKLFVRARLAPDSAANATSSFGLQPAVAGNNFLTPINGIYFRKAAGASTWEFLNRATNVETSTGAIATGADGVQINLGFFYDGASDLWASVNNAVVARITPAALPSVLMGITFGTQAGTAQARNMDIDQFFVAQER